MVSQHPAASNGAYELCGMSQYAQATALGPLLAEVNNLAASNGAYNPCGMSQLLAGIKMSYKKHML